VKLIDTHCHLAHSRLRPQLQAVLERARAAGVAAVVCAAGDLRESHAAAGIARLAGDVHFMAGVHPHEAKSVPGDYLRQVEQLAGQPKCAAVGEIGLDYHHNFSPPARQRLIFAEQLALAARLQAKIVVHTREAFDDTMSILADSRVDGSGIVFHSFTEGPACVRRALDCGASVSFSGIVTFGGAGEVHQSARLVPAGRLLVETDAPYLSPEPVRRMKTNEPANVAHVAAFLAELRGLGPDELAETTTANAVRFFGLPVDRGQAGS